MKWIALKTQQPPQDTEILVSDGVYVHEARKLDWGWSSPSTVSGYEFDFDLEAAPLYWAHKPKAPKVRPEDIPDPVAVRKAKYKRPPKKGTQARAERDARKAEEKKFYNNLMNHSPWVKILNQKTWPEGFGGTIEELLESREK